MAGMMQHPKIVRRPKPVRRSCDDAYEVDGTDFLARAPGPILAAIMWLV
jgi:hypothetical protein